MGGENKKTSYPALVSGRSLYICWDEILIMNNSLS
jgi:hypothetical protein